MRAMKAHVEADVCNDITQGNFVSPISRRWPSYLRWLEHWLWGPSSLLVLNSAYSILNFKKIDEKLEKVERLIMKCMETELQIPLKFKSS